MRQSFVFSFNDAALNFNDLEKQKISAYGSPLTGLK